MILSTEERIFTLPTLVTKTSAARLLEVLDGADERELGSIPIFAACAHGVEQHLKFAVHRVGVEEWLLEMLERVTAPQPEVEAC